MKNTNIQYFVEGEDEKKLLNTLKNKLRLIRPGKIQRLNVVQTKISMNILRTLKKGTLVVLVFDTDTQNTEILNYNIKLLNKSNIVSKVVTIPQVKNLEDELIRCCDIKKITELLNSRSKKDYKSDLIKVTNLETKLVEHHFNINLFWNQQPDEPFKEIHNESVEIKI